MEAVLRLLTGWALQSCVFPLPSHSLADLASLWGHKTGFPHFAHAEGRSWDYAPYATLVEDQNMATLSTDFGNRV